VTFTFEQVRQDGYGYRALHVNLDGVPPDDSWEQVFGDSPGHRSELTIAWEDGSHIGLP
jgi:hypothetical protein